MWKNDYQYTDYQKSFDVPDGDHQIIILGAKDVVSKTGKNMIEIQYKVIGSNNVPYVDRMVEGEYFGANMSRIFDVFGIQPGNFNYMTWRNKSAYAHFEHRPNTFTDNNGNTKTVMKADLIYFHNSKAPETATRTPTPIQQTASEVFDEGCPDGAMPLF